MELTTPISITPLSQSISYGDGLLFLGSCFADEVGSICRGLGFNAMVNPFGVLYNPASIANVIQRLHSGEPFVHEEVIRVGDEFFCTFSHNTDFWSPTEDELLRRVNSGLAKAHEHFLKAKWIVVSLGTAWAFVKKDADSRHCERSEAIQTSLVVSNCHKLPASRFERKFVGVRLAAELLSNMVIAFPDKQFIFTVSPLRHLKDGLHGNQLSKASLLLAVDEVCKSHENAHYFPAYEILLDELRDYRFYKEDMIHPTDQAVCYIWEKFVQYAVNPSEYPAMAAAQELKRMLQHKPLFPDSEAFKKFELLKERKISELKRSFPRICLDLI